MKSFPYSLGGVKLSEVQILITHQLLQISTIMLLPANKTYEVREKVWQ